MAHRLGGSSKPLGPVVIVPNLGGAVVQSARTAYLSLFEVPSTHESVKAPLPCSGPLRGGFKPALTDSLLQAASDYARKRKRALSGVSSLVLTDG
jgi:hypothetical protein